MSYTVVVSGHKMTETPEDARAHEDAIASKAKAFAASLEGVNGAYMDGATIGHVDLMPAPAESAAAETGADSGV